MCFGNSFNAYVLKGQDPAIYKSQQEFDKAAASVLEEMLPSLVAGAVDPEQNLPKMIEKTRR